ncbi:ribosome biogenesis GTP-binding protein YihA/YsxC [Ferroacidibacillus organovorans]|uniref:Probable GTP-binding protein EngB n=1 Tax=Ferroacidibacillus organovorans TaxID=1765683 RepID=A0A853KA87_9BACL|nr:ribosome biogenesis GTP-binding protein YihA/YsxC [Ferroacidibacillus organovorans]KYP80085.1 hypothetical protein AYJ22_12580 [Ferroacidibacillus organovorans]OAG93972.1 hypothetical protein AYW79_08065 [Ferroacidibacillus organovorans]
MIIKAAEFLTSAVTKEQFPEADRPELAMVGRSNVGKSSLINRMLNRRRLARTSATPGKTQTLNFYDINQTFRLVDLPGYGYANVRKSIRSEFGPMIEGYLTDRETLVWVIQLIDIRHPPSALDCDVSAYLQSIFYERHVIAATKADKIARGAYARQQHVIRKDLHLEADHPIFLTSADSGYGIDALWEHVEGRLSKGQSDVGDLL